jgi:hypothetical protein
VIRWRTHALLALLALFFTGAGLLFVPRLGVEVDEAIVANGIYDHGSPWYSWRFGRDELPIMLISYLGALKTWMYNVLFLLTPPRPLALRLPTLLLAAGTLWIFFSLLDRAVGRRAAWVGTALLATDTSYLLLNMTDYGPVTFQFVFKLTALLLLVRFHQGGSRAALGVAFFLLGLALWDKATFGWVLIGWMAAALALFPRELRAHWTLANLRVALPAMALGALPLIVYNVARPLETLRANARVEDAAVWGKASILARTLDGYVFFGFLTALEPGPRPGAPNHWYQSASIALSRLTGEPRHSLMLWAVGAALLALPLLWRTPARRPMLFGFGVCVATWLPMVFTAGAGAAAQHVILLWPFHLLALAAAAARIPPRAAIAATALLCASSLAVTNHYYADLIRNGPTLRWTDAMDPLHRYLADSGAPRIVVADWGIIETMNLLSQGSLPIYMADLSSDEAIRAQLRDPANLYVAHPQAIAFHPEERAALERVAAQEHYLREDIATIHDRNGRPAFDIFRFRKLHL